MAHWSTKPTAVTINGDEYLWLTDDPSGTPADTKATVDTVLTRTFSLAGFTEAAQDVVGAMVAAAGGSYDDTAGTITLPAGGGGLDAEGVRDTMATALTAGTGITITPNDAGDTITIALTTAAQPQDATLTALAGLTTAADKGFYATGSDTFGTYDLTPFARTLLDDASASAAVATLGLNQFVLSAAGRGFANGDVLAEFTTWAPTTFAASLASFVGSADGDMTVTVQWLDDHSDATPTALGTLTWAAAGAPTLAGAGGTVAAGKLVQVVVSALGTATAVSLTGLPTV